MNNYVKSNKYLSLAVDLVNKGKSEKAINSLERASLLFPEDNNILRFLAELLLNKKLIREASNVLENILKNNSDDCWALAELGRLHAKYGSSKKAYTLMSKAVVEAPENSHIRASYATACQRLGELPKAIYHYKHALNLIDVSAYRTSENHKKSTSFDVSIAEDLLWETLHFLSQGGVHAFASHGTLLGLVREGGLLPFDKDIDIGVPFSEFSRAKKLLESQGWIANKGNFGLVNPLAFLHQDTKISLDLCGFSVEKQSGKTIYGFWMKSIPKDWNRVIELDTIRLKKAVGKNGKKIWAIEDPEVIFKPFYGNWRVPEPDFVSVTGEPGLRGMSLLTRCYGFDRLYGAIMKRDLRRASKQVNVLLDELPEEVFLHKIFENIRNGSLK